MKDTKLILVDKTFYDTFANSCFCIVIDVILSSKTAKTILHPIKHTKKEKKTKTKQKSKTFIHSYTLIWPLTASTGIQDTVRVYI